MHSSYISRRPILILSGGLLAGIGRAHADSSDGRTLSAAEILKRMGAIYGSCKTYQDSGEVTTAFNGSGPGFSNTKPFSTAFVRPARLRFEFRSAFLPYDNHWRRYLVWADGAKTRTWWDDKPGIVESPSLELALAGATGVSGGSAQTVPAMLMPGRVWGRPLTDLVDLQRMEDALLGKAVCFRIQGALRGVNDPELQERMRQQILKSSGRDPGITTQEPRTLWIDRSLFVLRRIDAASQSSAGLRTQTLTTYEPSLDEVVAESQLRFDVPGAERR
jgi:hypothetical protein